MANKNVPKNAWTSTDQPAPGNRRGKAPRTKLRDACKRVKGWSEDDVWDHLVTEGFEKKDKTVSQALVRIWCQETKTTLPAATFQYDADAPFVEKCNVIPDLSGLPPVRRTFLAYDLSIGGSA